MNVDQFEIHKLKKVKPNRNFKKLSEYGAFKD
jgi:hypothetical protein